jgi:hypothetical protein
MPANSPVRHAEKRLRDAVNAPAVQERLLADLPNWRQLCASMDVIGDTDEAIAAFLTSPAAPRDVGRLYLHTYGLLQALFVQQDAVRHAAEAVGLAYTRADELRVIRDTRNDAVGHPSKRGDTRPESFGIVRHSLTADEFTLYSFDLGRADNFRRVRVREMIESQRAAVVAALDRIAAHVSR